MKYEDVEELYNKIDTLPRELQEDVKSFHNFRKAYLDGKGDVIYGLQWMDLKTDEIQNKINQINQ